MTVFSFESVALHFTNSEGHRLSARLELPDNPVAFGIYAHCFTCTKNITAAHVISKTLASLGIAMLRFDFMGLGESEGQFENTSVSSNISDIISAYTFLKENFTAPSLLIGHSLGGLAALYSLETLTDIKACVTLNAPSSTIHTAKRFTDEKTKILSDGFGEIDIVGRKYRVKSNFLTDLEKYFALHLDFIKIPVMVTHVLEDPIVPFSHGEEIFHQLKSPKSFVSLDQMDHLLKNRNHAEQVAQMIYGWSKRYLAP
ncbi:MAG: hypothetical protein HEEMFOPI_00095 [Holosporales bacterium]